MKLLVELAAEFVPHRGVAAVLYKAFHALWKRFAGSHHGCGSAHRNAGDYHLGVSAKDVVGNVNPLLDVVFVFPSHLNLVAVA